MIASSASAQEYTFDARHIALGGAGGAPNLAAKLVEEQRRYRSLMIPFGLIKVLSNTRVFYPNREDFDFSRAVEFTASPFHYAFGREDITGKSFFRDIVHARLNPDLSSYGSDGAFEIPDSLTAEGLVFLTWGKTFMMRQAERSFHGIYVGAGPYMGAQAYGVFNSDFLSAANGTILPAASLGVGGGETDQLALAITGGYKGRLPFFEPKDGVGARNGIYVAANYHYLVGFRLDEFNAGLTLQTDNFGRVSQTPPSPPFTLDWHTSRSGRGMAIDTGLEFVVNRWEFGMGVNGIANRIDWTDVTHHTLTLPTLFGGNDFIHIKRPPTDVKRRYELPVRYTGNVAYHQDNWSVLTQYTNGFMGDNLFGGFEYRFNTIELRGGGRMTDGRFFPSAGFGYNMTRTFGVDVAFFGTQTFLERTPHVGMAVSLRWDKGRPAATSTSPAAP